MARLRLFAGLRDLAGEGSTQIEGDTVDAVLQTAAERYGSMFRRSMANARVWVNGEEAQPSQAVGDDDEVALIPPVSGGAGVLDRPAIQLQEAAIPLALILVLVVANVMGDAAWWSTAVVLAVATWIGDVVATVSARGHDLPVLPAMASVLATVAAVWTLGLGGLGLAVVAAVVLPLIWAVASDSSRILSILSPVVVLSLIGSLAAGSLIAAPSVFEASEQVVGVFLAIALAVSAVGLAMQRFSHLPFGDPFSATALTAVLAAVIAAAVWGLDLVSFLIAGLVVAASLVAGRGLGSILRTRRVELVDRSPGYVTLLDGVMVAAPMFVITLRLVAG